MVKILHLITLLILMCFTSPPTHAIDWPTGLFATELGKTEMFMHKNLKGVVVHAKWKSIEPRIGEYNFSSIEQQVGIITRQNKDWILALHAGPHSPKFVKKSGELFIHRTSKGGLPIPKFWYGDTQEAMRRILIALGRKFRYDPHLKMVIIPQMTQDGLSGTFKNLKPPYKTLTEAGFTKPLWQDALMWTMHSAISAFPDTAIGIDLQELAGDASVAEFIMTAIENDPKLKRNMALVAMWLDGKKQTQQKLAPLLYRFPNPIFGYIRYPSAYKWAFPQGGYPRALKLAQRIGMRAVAISSNEFSHHTMDDVLNIFTKWTESLFQKNLIDGRR